MPRKLRRNPMQWSCRREREVSAQYLHADQNESLRSRLSEGQKALGEPDAMFSSEQVNQIRSAVFSNANSPNLRTSLLEGNKDHLLNQARSDLPKQELHVESLNECVGERQRQSEEQRLALQDAQYRFVESRREQVRLQQELSIKEIVLRNTQIRSMHEESVTNSSRRSLSAKIKRKSQDTSTAHFSIAANARTDEFDEQFWRCPGCCLKL